MDLSPRSPLLRPRAVTVVAVAAAVLGVGAHQLQDQISSYAIGAASAGVSSDPIAVPQPPTGTATADGLTRGTRHAYRSAAAAMGAVGIEMRLTSGYRSRAEQEQLYEEAIVKYGSPEAARVWVLPPDESHHVRGTAVDIAPRQAARWLDRHGARYGLCRTMEWEWWHFEYDAAWQRAGHCPQPQRRG